MTIKLIITILLLSFSSVAQTSTNTALPIDFKNGYSLMYETQALDKNQVSAKRPKVIMFGQKGNFILTYNSHKNGGSAQPGDVEKIETLEIIDDKMYLRELSFNGKTDPFAQTIEVNPKSCTQCHGQDPKGLWDPYNSWIGAYGSLSRGGMDFIRLGTPEHSKFKEYLKEQEVNPRYSFLNSNYKTFKKWSEDFDLFRPYVEEDMHNAIIIGDGHTTLPNQVLGMALGEHNFRRLGRQILSVSNEKKQAFQFLIKGLSLDENYTENPRNKKYNCAEKINDFFPASAQNKIKPFKIFTDEVLTSMKSDYLVQKSLVLQNNNGLSRIGSIFDPNDPFDFNMEDRKLVFDPFPISNLFSVNYRYNGSVILLYVLDILGLDYINANINVNSAKFSFYYGSQLNCISPGKNGSPYEDHCFDEPVERFFTNYLSNSFYSEELDNLNCDQLSKLSRVSISKYYNK